MTIQEVRAIAKKMGIQTNKHEKKAQLIKAIQKAEGNPDCFATQCVRDCNQVKCLWREDCLKTV